VNASTTELLTERLRLRRVRPGDEDAVLSLLSDERVVRYMLFPIFSAEQAAQFVQSLQAPPAAGEPAQEVFGMALGNEAGLVGLCGLVLDPTATQGEAWYLTAPPYWGHGYVTEAVHALVDHGFRTVGLHRVWASCLPENPASARVLEKLGFRREGYHRQNLSIHGAWRDSYTYAVVASEWPVAPGCSSA